MCVCEISVNQQSVSLQCEEKIGSATLVYRSRALLCNMHGESDLFKKLLCATQNVLELSQLKEVLL